MSYLPKTTSWQYWPSGCSEHARSEALRQELPYWLDVGATGPSACPVDQPEGGQHVPARRRRWSVTLAEEQTRALVAGGAGGLPHADQRRAADGAGAGLRRLERAGALLVDLEGHGREELFDGRRPVAHGGLVHHAVPGAAASAPDGESAEAALKAVKEQLRAVPKRASATGCCVTSAATRN